MSRRRAVLERLDLGAFELAPPQAWGSVRIVPVLRRDAPGDLRLALRRYHADLGAVALDGDPDDVTTRQTWYCGYIPHGLVVTWEDDGTPAAAFGGRLTRRDGKAAGRGWTRARILSRMVRREDRRRLRLLPLHVAMEGLLALHFGGPDVAWTEYSRRARSSGLSPRVETVVPGYAVPDLEDALRVFEIHRDQVGALLFVADALASAFVTSHPQDYAALHESLVEDFYGELVWQGAFQRSVGDLSPAARAGAVAGFEDLRVLVRDLREAWSQTASLMADPVFDRPVRSEILYTLGPFTLQRFVSELTPGKDNQIGECILRDDGTVEYLKTFRLSAAQSRRAYLLEQLARHDWRIDGLADALGTTRDDALLRLEKAGFGYLLREDVLAWAHKRAKERRGGR